MFFVINLYLNLSSFCVFCVCMQECVMIVPVVITCHVHVHDMYMYCFYVCHLFLLLLLSLIFIITHGTVARFLYIFTVVFSHLHLHVHVHDYMYLAHTCRCLFNCYLCYTYILYIPGNIIYSLSPQTNFLGTHFFSSKN